MSLIFATVNAGTNNFTNITIKSILQFHPSAKVLVVDVVPDKKFSPIDADIMKNVEVVPGITNQDIVPPVIDLSESNLDRKELVEVAIKMGRNPVEVSLNGDLQHTMNIQRTMDDLGENFILIDSDAPLIRPIDFVDGCKYATAGETRYENYSLMGVDVVLLSTFVQRFTPFVQWFNMDLIRKMGLFYYKEEMLKNSLDIAFKFSLAPDTLIFPTGSLFLRQFQEEFIPYASISSQDYVEHFGAGTWSKDPKSKNRFYSRYQHLFRNPIPMEEV